MLRAITKCLGVEQWKHFGNHSLRRSQAELVRRFGGTAGEILRAGDWSERALITYLDQQDVEREAHEQAILRCPPGAEQRPRCV